MGRLGPSVGGLVSSPDRVRQKKKKMEASDEARAQGEKKASAVDTSKSSFRTYRLVAVSFGVLCVLQATLNVTLRLNANTKSDIQTNISLLTEENNELLNNYTKLLLENKELQEKLEDDMWTFSKICMDENRPYRFTLENPELPNNLLNNVLQELTKARRELRAETRRRKDLELILQKRHFEVSRLENVVHRLSR